MHHMYILLWKGRAGQGILTAGNILGALAIQNGKYCKAFPSFGGERLGAPVNVYNYFDDRQIHLHSIIDQGNCVVSVDPYFVQTINLMDICVDGSSLLINCPDAYSDHQVHEFIMQNSGQIDPQKRGITIYRIDALKHCAKILPEGKGQNIVMLGGLIKLNLTSYFEGITTDEFRQRLTQAFSYKLDCHRLVDINCKLFDLGYQNIRKLSYEEK